MRLSLTSGVRPMDRELSANSWDTGISLGTELGRQHSQKLRRNEGRTGSMHMPGGQAPFPNMQTTRISLAGGELAARVRTTPTPKKSTRLNSSHRCTSYAG